MCNQLDIKIDLIAGEAPWQMGKHSRHLKVALNTMYDLLVEFPDMTFEEAAVRSCVAKNERGME